MGGNVDVLLIPEDHVTAGGAGYARALIYTPNGAQDRTSFCFHEAGSSLGECMVHGRRFQHYRDPRDYIMKDPLMPRL